MQYFNWSSISSLFANIKNPSITLPHVKVKSAPNIDYKYLKSLGFKAVIFDKDNTLTNPYEYEISDNMRSSLERCISEFGERGVAIFSNTAGNKDDAKNDYKDSKYVESNLGISVIHHLKQKPDGIEDVKRHFGDFCTTEEIVVVGDRYFTDILFGNAMGALTIKTDILTPHGENMFVKMARNFEDFIVNQLEQRQYKPLPHPFFNDDDICRIQIE